MPTKKTVAPAATAPAAEPKAKTFTQTFTVVEPKKHSVLMKMENASDELAFSSVYLNRAVFAALGIPEGQIPAKLQVTVKVTAAKVE